MLTIKMETKRKLILDTATRLFITYSVKSITIDDVSDHLGISKKTFYLYYSSKTELLLDVVKKLELAYKDHVQQLQLLKLPPLLELESFFGWILEQLQFYTPRFLRDLEKFYPEVHQQLKSSLKDQFTAFIVNNIKAGKHTKVYKRGIDPCSFANVCELQMHNLFRNDVADPGRRKEWIHDTCILFMNAIVKTA